MTLLKELQTIAKNTEIWPALSMDTPYITKLAKKPLSPKNTKKLKELNSTITVESEHFRKTILIEYIK